MLVQPFTLLIAAIAAGVGLLLAGAGNAVFLPTGRRARAMLAALGAALSLAVGGLLAPEAIVLLAIAACGGGVLFVVAKSRWASRFANLAAQIICSARFRWSVVGGLGFALAWSGFGLMGHADVAPMFRGDTFLDAIDAV